MDNYRVRFAKYAGNGCLAVMVPMTTECCCGIVPRTKPMIADLRLAYTPKRELVQPKCGSWVLQKVQERSEPDGTVV